MRFKMHYYQLLALSFGLIASSQSVSGSNGLTSEYAVDFKTIDGIHMQFPYHEPILQEEISTELHNELKSVSKEVMLYFDKLIADMLSKDQRPSTGRWLSIAKELYAILKKVPKQGHFLLKKSGYYKFSMGVIERMMVNSRTVAKTMMANNVPQEPEKLAEEVHKITTGLIEATYVSSVGVFAAWGRGTIDGRPAEDVMADITGKLRYHGYSKLLNLADGAFKVLLTFCKIKTKIDNKIHHRHD